MPRQRRLHAPRALHPLIARFVDREYRMYGDAEREDYLDRVPKVLTATDAGPRAYAPMSRHSGDAGSSDGPRGDGARPARRRTTE